MQTRATWSDVHERLSLLADEAKVVSFVAWAVAAACLSTVVCGLLFGRCGQVQTIFLLGLALPIAHAAVPPVVIHVATDAGPTHALNPLHLGCHSDSGFVHQVRGFHSNYIFGESFERPQRNVTYGVSADAWRSSGNVTLTHDEGKTNVHFCFSNMGTAVERVRYRLQPLVSNYPAHTRTVSARHTH